MSGLSASGLKTQIRSYTETDSNVLTDAVLENIILNAQYRIMRDVPIDADRKQQSVNLVPGQETINAPAGCLFIRAIQVYDSSSVLTGPNVFLEKKDMSYLQEYQDVTGTSAAQGKPKYYAMFGGATGTSSSTSGGLYLAPTPDAAYMHRIYYDMVPQSLVTKTSGTYVSQYFPQGLLYATLVEAYGFLKGPMDMLTLYENKYKQEVAKFAGVQIGRRRRDDYTDGTVRIPIKSPSP